MKALMRTFFVVGCLAVCSVAGAQTATSMPIPALSEVQKLKGENLRLKFALLQSQKQELDQAIQKVQEEAKALEEDFRATLKPSPEQTLNWQTLTFVGPPTVAATNGAAPSSTVAKPRP